jgi:hypothetical protein
VPAFGTLEFREGTRTAPLALGTSVVPNKVTRGHLRSRSWCIFSNEWVPRKRIALGEKERRAQLREAIGGSFLARAAQLGRRTGGARCAGQ